MTPSGNKPVEITIQTDINNQMWLDANGLTRTYEVENIKLTNNGANALLKLIGTMRIADVREVDYKISDEETGNLIGVMISSRK